MFQTVTEWYVKKGVDAAIAPEAAWWTNLGALVLCAVILHFLLKFLLVRGVRKGVQQLKLENAEIILGSGFLRSLAHLVPAIFLYWSAPLFLGIHGTEGERALNVITLLYLLIISVFVTYALINGFVRLYDKLSMSKEMPITGLAQVFKIVIALAALILAVSILIDRSPVFIFSGLGAISAILLLVYKDVILGFVAGIQLVSNRMLAVGDWIEMPKYDADGDVEEIALTTVKVRNWDKTRTTIPTYALISDSFKNWRGMIESGGRRIKRSLYIDLDSIRLMDPKLKKHLQQFILLKDYFEKKEHELAAWHKKHHFESAEESGINGRRLTNIGTYRAYIEAYLRNNPLIRQDMTLIVRQLAPDERGLPLEVYCFTDDIRWVQHEAIQSDIFDHLIAVASHFDLRLYQNPTGNDIRMGLNAGMTDAPLGGATP